MRQTSDDILEGVQKPFYLIKKYFIIIQIIIKLFDIDIYSIKLHCGAISALMQKVCLSESNYMCLF